VSHSAVRSEPRPERAYHHGALAQALQAAVVQIVAERGIGAVTMAECARRAGVTAGAPYRHYASLDDLILAAARSCYEHWNARRDRHVIDADRPAEALRELLGDFFAFARDEPGAFVLIFDSGLQRHSELIQRWGEEGYQQLLRVVSSLTGRSLRESHVQALGIVALVLGHAKMSLGGFSGIPLERAADLSLRALEQMLGQPIADVGPPGRSRGGSRA
jgi:AcrR family transcriptional regulator